MSKRCAPSPGLNLPRMSLPSSMAFLPRMSRWLSDSYASPGHGSLHPLRSGRPHPDLAVMQHGGITGPHFGGGHPHVLCEVGLDDDVLVVDGAAGRHVERLRHLHDDVGLDVPAVVEGERRRRRGRVASRRAGIGPRRERVDLAIDEPALVGQVRVAGIGEPGRHLLRDHGGLDRARPRSGLLVGDERHRGDFAGAMAGLTVRLQDGQDVLVERGIVCAAAADASSRDPTTAIRLVLMTDASASDLCGVWKAHATIQEYRAIRIQYEPGWRAG